MYNNSLVVECGERSRYIPYTDIYITDASMYSYSYSTSFDGEGAITSAIDYVTNPDQPTAYTLTGHGEGSLPATFSESLEKDNITVSELSLLNMDEIPEDADLLIIYAPQSDISADEAEILSDYAAAGGFSLPVISSAAEKSNYKARSNNRPARRTAQQHKNERLREKRRRSFLCQPI